MYLMPPSFIPHSSFQEEVRGPWSHCYDPQLSAFWAENSGKEANSFYFSQPQKNLKLHQVLHSSQFKEEIVM